MLLFKLIVFFVILFAIGADENKNDETSGEIEPSENTNENNEVSAAWKNKTPKSKGPSYKMKPMTASSTSKKPKSKGPTQIKQITQKKLKDKLKKKPFLKKMLNSFLNKAKKFKNSETFKKLKKVLVNAVKELIIGVIDSYLDVDEVFEKIDSALKNNEEKPEIYWKCAIENLSSKTLAPLGTTPFSGDIATELRKIPSNKTGIFVWEGDSESYGAAGVVHYRFGEKILNIVASYPNDLESDNAWANVHISDNKEDYESLCDGTNGAQDPTEAGEWGEVEGVKFLLSNEEDGEFRVIVNDLSEE
ncbi:hydra actinoporin-like toxin 4 [Hydra vulgaris]|uniref:Hydra actinoporin-like toxin 4 n=1 Tax=Hydra vulgaris TaxID=6087 RepID=A0ABM4D0X1_HYDVU